MNNKILIHLSIPDIDEEYDLFIHVNIRIGTLIKLLNKSLSELSSGIFVGNNKRKLYNTIDSNYYDINALILKTNIRNGSHLILL